MNIYNYFFNESGLIGVMEEKVRGVKFFNKEIGFATDTHYYILINSSKGGQIAFPYKLSCNQVEKYLSHLNKTLYQKQVDNEG